MDMSKPVIGNGKVKYKHSRKTKHLRNLAEDKEIAKLKEQYEKITSVTMDTFKEFPLSKRTQDGLLKLGFQTPTEIQKMAIGIALQGQDVLGAARTGSGKTLAFLIPVMELLWREKWSPNKDGVGALIITPTRELAYQIYEVLRKVGVKHDISAALIIGGKDVGFERSRIGKSNIIICTPGRLLQHMDETPDFHYDNMRILVLDEADKILELGFKPTMNAIMENLPMERQTLLFSATQTRSVSDLARVSLRQPVFVSVHEHAKHSTPDRLQQSYIVCNAEDKLNLLWSFIKHHQKKKLLVFMASCKQVKYVYESFCRLRPGLSLLALHGMMQQLRRVDVYDSFCRKQHAVLFATDIAARGLDFPSVDWVVQMDCPEDTNTYIHRAGRTARYQGDGESLLLLLPSEERSMISQLEQRQIPINKIEVNPSKQLSISKKLECLCAEDVELKEKAQRSFVAYIKSVFLMKDKSVFDVNHIDLDRYAQSLGLATCPRVRFIQKRQKNNNRQQRRRQEREETRQREAEEVDKERVSQQQQREKVGALWDDGGGGGDDELLMVKQSAAHFLSSSSVVSDSDDAVGDVTEQHHSAQSRDVMKTSTTNTYDALYQDTVDSIRTSRNKKLPPNNPQQQPHSGKDKQRQIISKVNVAKKLLKRNVQLNKKVKFVDDGDSGQLLKQEIQSVSDGEGDEDDGDVVVESLEMREAEQVMRRRDEEDKAAWKDKLKQKKKLRRKRRRQGEEEGGDESNEQVQLPTLGSDSGSDNEAEPVLPSPPLSLGDDDSEMRAAADLTPPGDHIDGVKRLKKGDGKKRKNKKSEVSDVAAADLSRQEELALALLNTS